MHSFHSPLARWLAPLALCLGLCLAAVPVAAEPELRGVVNVNTATDTQLAALPGIGASKAEAIVALRDARGGFDAVDDLLEVKGIGAKALERIRPYVALEGRTTLEPR